MIDKIKKSKEKLSIPSETIMARMKLLAEYIKYEYADLQHLANAMYCEIIGKGGRGEDRSIYTNGRYAALGDTVMRMLIADELFSSGKPMEEIYKHKNSASNSVFLCDIDLKLGIYRYAYDNYGFPSDSVLTGHAPIPARDLYVDAIVGAIYKDRGLDYTREWLFAFLERNGIKVGENRVYDVPPYAYHKRKENE